MSDNEDEYEISPEKINKLGTSDTLKKELARGKRCQEIVGFSDTTMAKFYRSAYQIFERKDYEDAADAFLFLTALNADNHDYWLGLGIATQMCANYEGAIDAYEMAAMCQIDSPVPYFYLGKCFFAMHEKKNAIQALELAIEYSDGIDEYIELKYQAKAAMAALLDD